MIYVFCDMNHPMLFQFSVSSFQCVKLFISMVFLISMTSAVSQTPTL